MSKINTDRIGTRDGTLDIDVKSIMIRDDSMENLGDYEQGLELTQQHQYIWKDESKYTVKLGHAPFVLTGVWEFDKEKLESYGTWDHSALTNRDIEGGHPAGAITYEHGSVFPDNSLGKELQTLKNNSSDYQNVGSFEQGATITERNQALRVEVDGRLYRWAGDLPKIVTAGSTPENTGGVHSGAWLEVGKLTLREELQDDGGAALVGNADMVFNSVSDMVASIWLKEGFVVRTLGYYEAGDGGGGTYIIQDVSAAPLDGGSAHEMVSGQYAVLTPDATGVNPYQYGAYGDGIQDDTVALDTLFLMHNNINFGGTGVFRRSAVATLVRSNTRVDMTGAEIKLLPHNTGFYEIFQAYDQNNLYFKNISVDGNRAENSFTGGEWGHGISLRGCSDVLIENIKTKNCWGDGVYIGAGEAHAGCDRVVIKNHHSKNDRRQGMSLISGRDIHIVNPRWENVNGTPPSAGLDIEPNDNTAYLENIVIDNPTTVNCAGSGIEIMLLNMVTNGVVPKVIDITINNHRDEGSNSGFTCNRLNDSGLITGRIVTNNPVWLSNKFGGFGSRTFASNGPSVMLHRPYIANNNTAKSTSITYSSAISIYSGPSDGAAGYLTGNITVFEPSFGTPNFMPKKLITATGSNSMGLDKVNIIDPVYIATELRGLPGFVGPGEVKITDRYRKWFYVAETSATLNADTRAGRIICGPLTTRLNLSTLDKEGDPDITIVSGSGVTSVYPPIGGKFVGQALNKVITCSSIEYSELVVRKTTGLNYLVVSNNGGWTF